MRPAGEVHQALLQACAALATAQRGATLRELAAQACVGRAVAGATVKNMRRAGVLAVPRTRIVTYRNRPVAEYVPASMAGGAANDASAGVIPLLQAWR